MQLSGASMAGAPLAALSVSPAASCLADARRHRSSCLDATLRRRLVPAAGALL
jgi:hypothetical protein